MSRSISFEKGQYYHVFNRGVDKRIIFEITENKERFQKLLYLCNGSKVVHLSVVKEKYKGDTIYTVDRGKPLVNIGAYCIMGSHFHLLLHEYVQNGVSQFMQKLATAYTMYFNIRKQRSGSLFEGRFRARHIVTDEHLKYLFSYIHLNPVEHLETNWKETGIKNLSQAMRYLIGYRFSSFIDYLGVNRVESVILNTSQFPEYFSGKKDFQTEIIGWLKFQDADPTFKLSSRFNLEDSNPEDN